ncbi:sigma-70 non-essential region-containing protein [Klebsiella pneumoniae subsp. pneumoniae]|nr:sigma-70 non-essential region-containing protein [Klebsiella pneumoniae subsp. pneumoniae]
MPKKNFITLFTGNETSETWFNAAVAMNKPWSEKLLEVKEDVQRGLQKLQQIEEETGLTIEQVKRYQPSHVHRRSESPSCEEKRWLKRTCVWLSLSPRNTPTAVCSSST